MEAYRIRNYKNGDFSEISKIWENTGLGNKERGDDESVIKKTLTHGGVFLVLELKKSKKIIGTSWLTNDGRRLYLHHFGIKPVYQGKKYSKVLLEATLEYAKKLKMQIKLEVHKNNSVAIKLYKQAGFSLLGDYQVFIIRDLKNSVF